MNYIRFLKNQNLLSHTFNGTQFGCFFFILRCFIEMIVQASVKLVSAPI